jgi:ribose transport system substrate-binding protein
VNKILKFLTPFFALSFLVLLILNVKYMLSGPFVQGGKPTLSTRGSHFAFFLPEADYSFFKELKKGAIEAARVVDCSISFHPVDMDPLSLEMARYTGIDGLAVYPYQKDEKLISSLTKIYDSGIPIVQIENQVLNKPKAVFIGTNSFDFGKAIGRLTLLSENKNLKIALVYSDKNPGLMADDSLLEMGVKSILGKRISVMRSFRTSQNPLDAEKLAYKLIQSKENYNLFVFTDSNDTLVAVQAIIDMNLVGSAQVIGFGNDSAIRGYIDKGVILGSIVRDPYHIGFNAVLALAEIKKSGYTSAFVDTGISILEKGNGSVEEYGGIE